MRTTDLFACAQAHARRTDPPTSHEAAASIVALLAKQEAVLHVFNKYKTLTLEQLVANYFGLPQCASGIRTRASELVKLGYLRDSGRTTKTKSGRNAIIWEIV